jgi:uncharacterized protein (TIGR00369 family)
MLNIEILHDFFAPLFPGLMRIRFIELAKDRVVGELEVRPDFCTEEGILHGSAYMAFADTLGAVGIGLNLNEGKRQTTTDSTTKFITPARVNTKVIGESIPLHRGRTTMVWQTTIRGTQGKLYAVVTHTQLALDK